MSIVAWDGKTLAADKQATNNGMRHLTTKLKRGRSLRVFAYTGDQDSAEGMLQWFEDGADAAKFPAYQNDKERWARLIVASEGGLVIYERTPHPILVDDAFMAWGAGRDYAMGAMACGKTAREAVEIAMRFDTSCGLGIDEIVCKPWSYGDQERK